MRKSLSRKLILKNDNVMHILGKNISYFLFKSLILLPLM